MACDPEDWVPESIDDFFQHDVKGMLVAELEDRVIGCFAYEWHPSRKQAYMMAMRIDPAVQGQGLGSAFCKAQIDWLTAAGAEAITLLSEHENLRAHRTVEKNGFVKRTPWLIAHAQVGDLPADAVPTQAPASDELRQWWAGQAAGQYLSLPGSGWIIFPSTPADFAGELLLHLGTEGALLWGRDGGEWIVRWASGSPKALRTLLATFANLARAGGAEMVTISLPGHLEPILAEAGITLPEPWRAFLFVYTSQPNG